MTRSLDAFPNEFWYVQAATVKYSNKKPPSVQQALLEMGDGAWCTMVDNIFTEYDVGSITIDDVITLIRETNTCEGLNSDLSVWVDTEGYFKIKVYYVG